MRQHIPSFLLQFAEELKLQCLTLKKTNYSQHLKKKTSSKPKLLEEQMYNILPNKANKLTFFIGVENTHTNDSIIY